ncbi:MAG TPA: imelysin family protein [Haliangium sp.]|nr:imelysin family protein [Haliangium sp.]
MIYEIHSRQWLLALSLLVAPLAGCGDDGGSAGPDDGSTPSFEDYAQAQAIVDDFADAVVVPTYASLATALVALDSAAQTLAADRSDANLEAARKAWVAARAPWEASEGFLFGPVDGLGLDPALDSWPVDRSALDAVIASNDELTEQYVTNLDDTLHGFHTAEYLLFGVGGAKTAADLSDRELAYLTSVTSLLVQVSGELEASWTTGVNGGAPYVEVFKSAGAPANAVYPSLTSAGEEIVRGMIGIADEVANGKIADPFDQQDTTLVESQFSFNSLTDFTNNVRSIQHAYTAEVPFASTSGIGLDEYIASVDLALDTRLKAEIQAAIDALGQIPEPFDDAITDTEAANEIQAAQEALRTVQTTLEQDVLPLFL